MKKLAWRLLSVALIAVLVFGLSVTAFAANEKKPFEFKIKLDDAIEIEDVILQYPEDGEVKELSLKEVLKETVFTKIGGRAVAEAVAFDRDCNGLPYDHVDEETVAGKKGTVTFLAAPDGGINCPDIIQIPKALLQEGANQIAYAVCIGFEDGTLLNAACGLLKNGVLGDLVNLGSVEIKNHLAKIVISSTALNSLGAQNNDVIRILLTCPVGEGETLERMNDHDYRLIKVTSKPRGEGQSSGSGSGSGSGGSHDKPAVPAYGRMGGMLGAHSVSIRIGNREIGLAAVPVNILGVAWDRTVLPFVRPAQNNGKTEINVHAGIIDITWDPFDPLGSLFDLFH